MPSSKEQLHVIALAMNDVQGKTKEPVTKDLIPRAKNGHAVKLLVSIISKQLRYTSKRCFSSCKLATAFTYTLSSVYVEFSVA